MKFLRKKVNKESAVAASKNTQQATFIMPTKETAEEEANQKLTQYVFIDFRNFKGSKSLFYARIVLLINAY